MQLPVKTFLFIKLDVANYFFTENLILS